MAISKLADSVIRATAKAYNAAEGNSYKAAQELGISRSTFISRVITGKTRKPELFKEFPVCRGGKKVPPKEKAQRSLAQDVELHRAQQEAREAAAKLKDAWQQIQVLEDRINGLEWANNVSAKPAEWTYVERTNRKREHMPELFTSDFQVGEVVRATETEAGYAYSPEIFRERYRRMIDTVDYLAHHHGGNGWQYPGILYLRGGDTLDGSIHPEDSGAQTMSPLECVELVFEEESAGIQKLRDSFGRVDVKTPGAAGNHDRATRKPVSKKAFAWSYDRLIHKMLVNHFRRDGRVTFQTSESFDVRYPVYDRNVILTHGDRMGSSGGQGFIGPAATILRGWQKVMQEQAALGFVVHEVRNGHFHTPFWMPFGWSNGCMPGYSEFAKSFRMRPTPPMQLFGFHHRKRGLVDMKPLTLVG